MKPKLGERESLIGRGRELEEALFAALAPLAAKETVTEVRGGLGLLAAVEHRWGAGDSVRETPGRGYIADLPQGCLVNQLRIVLLVAGLARCIGWNIAEREGLAVEESPRS